MVRDPGGYEAQVVAGDSSWLSGTGHQVADDAGPGDVNLAVRPFFFFNDTATTEIYTGPVLVA